MEVCHIIRYKIERSRRTTEYMFSRQVPGNGWTSVLCQSHPFGLKGKSVRFRHGPATVIWGTSSRCHCFCQGKREGEEVMFPSVSKPACQACLVVLRGKGNQQIGACSGLTIVMWKLASFVEALRPCGALCSGDDDKTHEAHIGFYASFMLNEYLLSAGRRFFCS